MVKQLLWNLEREQIVTHCQIFFDQTPAFLIFFLSRCRRRRQTKIAISPFFDASGNKKYRCY